MRQAVTLLSFAMLVASTATEAASQKSTRPAGASPQVTPASVAPAVPSVAAAQAVPAAAPATLRVDAVRFQGNRRYDEQTLQALVAPALGKDMSLEDLRGLAEQVRLHYDANGYKLARVLLPQQDFSPGKPVTFVVLEGWLGRVSVTGSERFEAARVNRFLAEADVREGEAFTFSDLELGLTRLNRLSGIKAASVLKPGTAQGATDVQVTLTEQPRINAAVEVNNQGSRSTGQTRLMPSLEATNLTGRGDALAFIGLASLEGPGTYFGRLGYVTPVNARGMKAGTYYAQGNVAVGGALSALDVRGDNQGYGVGVQQDIIRKANDVVVLEAWLESLDLTQRILGTVTSNDRIRKLRVGANRDMADDSGRTLYAVNLHQGLGATLGAMPNDSTLSSRAIGGADNQFTKLTVDWARIQRINERMNLQARFSAQHAFQGVVTSEQFAVGGYGSVVGQAPSAHLGDSGFSTGLEGRYAILPDQDAYQLAARLDHGRVYVRDTFIGQASSTSLSGMSLGVIATPHPKVFLRADYARPIGRATDDSHFIYFQARYSY